MYDDIYERVERIIRARGRRFWWRFTRIQWLERHASGAVSIETESLGPRDPADAYTVLITITDADNKEHTKLIFFGAPDPREIRKFSTKIELLHTEEGTLMPLWLKYRNYDDPNMIIKELSVYGEAGYDQQHRDYHLRAEYWSTPMGFLQPRIFLSLVDADYQSLLCYEFNVLQD